MPRQACRQMWDDFAGSECTRHRDSQCAAQAVDLSGRVLRILKIAQNLTRSFEQYAARIRRRDLSGGAQEQLDPESGLQVGDHSRYRRLRDPEFAREPPEAACLCGTHKVGQFLELVTPAAPA